MNFNFFFFLCTVFNLVNMDLNSEFNATNQFTRVGIELLLAAKKGKGGFFLGGRSTVAKKKKKKRAQEAQEAKGGLFLGRYIVTDRHKMLPTKGGQESHKSKL